MAVNPIGLYNPCLYNLGNDDFMYNTYLANNKGNVPFTGYYPPQTDTFERQSSGLGLKLGGAAGLGAGLGTYYFGNILGAKLLDNGKLSEDFINELRKNNINEYKALKESRKIIESLKDKPAELAKYIEENAALYGIKGDEAAIKKAAEELANDSSKLLNINKNQLGLRRNIYGRIKNFKAGKIRAVTSHIDKTTKALKKNAPEYLQKAYNSFKLKKAGKVGLIAAGVGLVLGWLFGK